MITVLTKAAPYDYSKISDPMVECLECGMPEREEYALQDKHVCNRVTDRYYPGIPGMVLKIGKRRWVKIAK